MTAVEGKLKVVEKETTKNTKDIRKMKERMDKYKKERDTIRNDTRQGPRSLILCYTMYWNIRQTSQSTVAGGRWTRLPSSTS